MHAVASTHNIYTKRVHAALHVHVVQLYYTHMKSKRSVWNILLLLLERFMRF